MPRRSASYYESLRRLCSRLRSLSTRSSADWRRCLRSENRAGRGGAVERPVMPEDLDCAARHERQAARQPARRSSATPRSAGEPVGKAPRQLVPVKSRAISNGRICGGVLAAQLVRRSRLGVLERRNVRRGDVLDPRERPDALGADEAWEPAGGVVGEQAAEEIAFGLGRPARRSRQDTAITIGAPASRARAGDVVGSHLGPLIVVGASGARPTCGRPREERGGVDDACEGRPRARPRARARGRRH